MAGDSLLWAGKGSKVMKITGHKTVYCKELVHNVTEVHNKSHIQLAVWGPAFSLLLDTVIISSWLVSEKQQMLT